MAADGALEYPIVAVNNAMTKHLFDNRYGTGQSTLDGIIRATNRLLAGRALVISGYGWCGRGVAMRGAAMGANVVVCEVDPLKALEAVMDGYRVMPAVEAAALCDIWVTVTGDINVIDADMMAAMKDGAIICNSGHFNVEINIDYLRSVAVSVSEVRPLVEEFTMPDGRKICLIADGRLVNLACAEGHPANVMDMSFANQALCAEYLVSSAAGSQHGSQPGLKPGSESGLKPGLHLGLKPGLQSGLKPGVYDVPEEIDASIAALKLASMGIKIDVLTEEQKAYLSSWEAGTC